MSADYKCQEPRWNLSNTMLQVHSRKNEQERQTHPERPLQTLTLSPKPIVLSLQKNPTLSPNPMVFL